MTDAIRQLLLAFNAASKCAVDKVRLATYPFSADKLQADFEAIRAEHLTPAVLQLDAAFGVTVHNFWQTLTEQLQVTHRMLEVANTGAGATYFGEMLTQEAQSRIDRILGAVQLLASSAASGSRPAIVDFSWVSK